MANGHQYFSPSVKFRTTIAFDGPKERATRSPLVNRLLGAIDLQLRFGYFAFDRIEPNLKVRAATVKFVIGDSIWNSPTKHCYANDEHH
jgi:hypothetical protein